MTLDGKGGTSAMNALLGLMAVESNDKQGKGKGGRGALRKLGSKTSKS